MPSWHCQFLSANEMGNEIFWQHFDGRNYLFIELDFHLLSRDPLFIFDHFLLFYDPSTGNGSGRELIRQKKAIEKSKTRDKSIEWKSRLLIWTA